jgi:chromosome segregation ATPase
MSNKTKETKAELLEEIKKLRSKVAKHEEERQRQLWEIHSLKAAVNARDELLRDLADEYRTEAAALVNRADRRFARIMRAFPPTDSKEDKTKVTVATRYNNGEWEDGYALAR